MEGWITEKNAIPAAAQTFPLETVAMFLSDCQWLYVSISKMAAA